MGLEISLKAISRLWVFVDNFERKFQSNISPSNQIFEQPEEELIGFKGGKQNGTKQVLIITH